MHPKNSKTMPTRLRAGDRHRLLGASGDRLLLLLLLRRHVGGAGLLVADTLSVLEVAAARPTRALKIRATHSQGREVGIGI